MGKSKHTWTAFEDEKLVESLLELVHSGRWKADNCSFRPGYQQELKKKLEEKIIGCRLKTKNIDSSFKLLNRKYHVICEMAMRCHQHKASLATELVEKKCS